MHVHFLSDLLWSTFLHESLSSSITTTTTSVTMTPGVTLKHRAQIKEVKLLRGGLTLSQTLSTVRIMDLFHVSWSHPGLSSCSKQCHDVLFRSTERNAQNLQWENLWLTWLLNVSVQAGGRSETNTTSLTTINNMLQTFQGQFPSSFVSVRRAGKQEVRRPSSCDHVCLGHVVPRPHRPPPCGLYRTFNDFPWHFLLCDIHR